MKLIKTMFLSVHQAHELEKQGYFLVLTSFGYKKDFYQVWVGK